MGDRRRRYRVARAAAATLFDGGGGVEPADLDALLADLDDFLAAAGWRTALAMRAAFAAVQLAPYLGGRLRPFTRLGAPERAEVLLWLEGSGSLGKAWAGLKLLLAMLWFDGPAGGRQLPEQVRKTRPLEDPVDLAAVRLGPEGPLPAPPGRLPGSPGRRRSAE